MVPITSTPVVYAGTGQTAAPAAAIDLCRRLGRRFAQLGFTLSGNDISAPAAAFSAGCADLDGIREAWDAAETGGGALYSADADELLKHICPGFRLLTAEQKEMLGSFARQLLGRSLDRPADLIVAYGWPVNGPYGPVGERIARNYDIDVFDLAREEAMNDLKSCIDWIKDRPTLEALPRVIAALEEDAFVAALENECGARIIKARAIAPCGRNPP